MKGKYNILPAMFLLGVVMGNEINAQNNNQSIVIQKEYSQSDTSSVEPRINWGGEFDMSDIQNLHQKIDSVFRQMSGGMDMGFSAFDSLPGMFNGFGDFDQLMDSSFRNEFPIAGNDRGLEDIVKHFDIGSGDNMMMPDSAFLKQHPDMDVHVKTDTIIKDGSKTIVQSVTINSKDMADLGGDFYSDDMFNEDAHVQGKNSKKEIMPSGKTSLSRVEDITLQDAAILNKGGVTPKLIVSPALIPQKEDEKIKVETKNGKEVNNVCISLRFNDKATTELLILDSSGNTVHEEKKKNFDGELSYAIDVKDSSAPYYFLVIRNNQLFGKKILDID